MPDIMSLLACVSQCLDSTTIRQLARVSEAMLAMSGRVTMRGMARWAGTGGSLSDDPTFFTTSLSWGKFQWVLIRHHLLDQDDVIVLGGDDVVVTKSGKTPMVGAVFFLLVWQSRPRTVFSESIPDQCQTSHLLPGHDGTTGPAAPPPPAEVRQENILWETGPPEREQKSASARGELSPYLCFVQERSGVYCR